VASARCDPGGQDKSKIKMQNVIRLRFRNYAETRIVVSLRDEFLMEEMCPLQRRGARRLNSRTDEQLKRV
jgi:hypothetical protein